jgi:ankyrin repeat protein
VVQILIDAKMDVNVQNNTGRTPLMYFVKNLEVSKLLIESGADLAKKDCIGNTASHLACKKGEVDVVQLLIDAKADVNAQDNAGQTPLMWVKKGLVVKLMIESGADLQVKDDKGNTALHYAWEKEADVAQILVDAKADVNALNNMGRTPLINYLEKK